MCGRFVLFTEEEDKEINDILSSLSKGFNGDSTNFKTGEIFPTDKVPVVLSNFGRKEIEVLKWGFPNFNQKSGVLINAKAETIDERPTFKNLLFSKRCLIPASGFYEWKTVEKKKEKYLIKPKGENFFYMAGLYNVHKNSNGEDYGCFVILTTKANQVMSQIHNRMPVIFSGDNDWWISESSENVEFLKAMLNATNKNLELKKVS